MEKFAYLSLRVIEISRDCHNSILDICSQVTICKSKRNSNSVVGGFSPCQQPSPPSEGQYLVIIYSVCDRFYWMKLGGNPPPGHNALLFSTSGTESFICPVFTDKGRQTKSLGSHGPLPGLPARWNPFHRQGRSPAMSRIQTHSSEKHTDHKQNTLLLWPPGLLLFFIINTVKQKFLV